MRASVELFENADLSGVEEANFTTEFEFSLDADLGKCVAQFVE
jgi:hypothetical protein